MAGIGGSIARLGLNGRTFPVAADAEAQRKLGGWENEVQANGDGLTARLIKTRVPLSLTGVTAEIDDDRGDHEFLQDLANQKGFFTLTIEYASGATYQATAQLTGELNTSSQSATAPLNFMGPGTLTRQ